MWGLKPAGIVRFVSHKPGVPQATELLQRWTDHTWMDWDFSNAVLALADSQMNLADIGASATLTVAYGSYARRLAFDPTGAYTPLNGAGFVAAQVFNDCGVERG